MAVVFDDNNGFVLRKLEKFVESEDEESHEEEERQPRTKKGYPRTNVHYKWTRVELDEGETPEERLEKQRHWIKDTLKESYKGFADKQMRYMQCGAAGAKRKCPAKHKIIMENGISTELYFNGQDHSFHEDRPKVHGIEADVRRRLEELYQAGFKKPNHIHEEIKREFPDFELRYKQLSNFLYHMRKKYKGVENICYDTLKEWAEDNAAVPQDENRAFVIAYKGKISARSAKKTFFQTAISTRRLIKMAKKWCKYLNADSSEFIDIKGLPMSAIGLTDANGDFHPIMVFLTKLEVENDWKFAFDALIQAIEAYGSDDENEEDRLDIFETPSLISNIDPLVQKGFEASFGEMKKYHPLWTQCYSNMANPLLSLNDKELKTRMMTEIQTLRLLPTEEMFERGISLFFEKYQGHENPEMPKVLSRLREKFVMQNSDWFEASDLEASKFNSPLERLILDLKTSYNWTKDQPLPEILADILKIVQDWSVSRDPARTSAEDLKVIHERRRIKDDKSGWKQRKSGWEWLKSNHLNEKEMLEDGQGRVYFRSDSDNSNKDLEFLIAKWKNVHISASTLEELFRVSQALHVVKYSDEEAQLGICSCAVGMKRKICKHSIGIAIQRKRLEKPKKRYLIVKKEKQCPKVKEEKPQKADFEQSSESEDEEINFQPSRFKLEYKTKLKEEVQTEVNNNDFSFDTDLINETKENETNDLNSFEDRSLKKLEALPECFLDEDNREFEFNPRKSRISQPELKTKKRQAKTSLAPLKEQKSKPLKVKDKNEPSQDRNKSVLEVNESRKKPKFPRRTESKRKAEDAEFKLNIFQQILQRTETDPDKIVLESILQRNMPKPKRSKLESNSSSNSSFDWD